MQVFERTPSETKLFSVPAATSEDESLFGHWISEMSVGLSSISQRVGNAINSLSDDFVENLDPDDAQSDDDSLNDNHDVEMQPLARVLQRTVDNLQQRGHNLTKLESTFEELSTRASEHRSMATELRVNTAEQGGGCCLIQ